jgi:hypothetical protein
VTLSSVAFERRSGRDLLGSPKVKVRAGRRRVEPSPEARAPQLFALQRSADLTPSAWKRYGLSSWNFSNAGPARTGDITAIPELKLYRYSHPTEPTYVLQEQREYARVFGRPPRRDVERVRDAVAGGDPVA